MSLRLSSQRFYFRLWFYLLPAVATFAAMYLRFHTDLFAGLSMEHDDRFYIGVAILTTLIWNLVADQNRLCQVDDLFLFVCKLSRCARMLA